MPELKYGLNLTKKPGLPPLGSRAPPKKTIFDEDDSPDEDAGQQDKAEAITSLGGLNSISADLLSSNANLSTKSKAALPTGPRKRKAPQVSQYSDLSSRHTSLKHAEEAQVVDPSVYDYDAVYDSIHVKPANVKSDKTEGPKYMTSLLAAAEIRKRDQLRAKEKALQREREDEGNEYVDKEKFVTGAYKAQQEELRRVEEEEKLRESVEMDKRRKQGGGMTGLYKDLLSREDERHERAMKAAEDLAKNGPATDIDKTENKRKDEITLAKEKGVTLNEDGQIVDKRQLLTAGLNVSRKPKSEQGRTEAAEALRDQRQVGKDSRQDQKLGMRERQTRMLERQLEESAKRAADEEQTEKEALERTTKRRTTEKDVSSAKERYLARKRAAEEEGK